VHLWEREVFRQKHLMSKIADDDPEAALADMHSDTDTRLTYECHKKCAPPVPDYLSRFDESAIRKFPDKI
jgi:hypothetical protein